METYRSTRSPKHRDTPRYSPVSYISGSIIELDTVSPTSHRRLNSNNQLSQVPEATRPSVPCNCPVTPKNLFGAPLNARQPMKRLSREARVKWNNG